MTILEYDLPGTSVTSISTSTAGSTSNMLLPKLGHAVLPAFLVVELLIGGTSVLSPQPRSVISVFAPASPSIALDSSTEFREPTESVLPPLAKSVRSLRRRSGLTWDELAHIFGVSRRTLHNWSTGGQISASNARSIASVISLVHEVDAGNPKLTRSRLLAPAEDGTTPYSRLAQQRTRPARDRISFQPYELLSAHHDSPDPTGALVDYERLT